MNNDDNVFAPGESYGSVGGGSTRNHDPAPVDLMAIFERAWQLAMDNLAVVGIGIVLLFGTSMLTSLIAVPIQLTLEVSPDENTRLAGLGLRLAVSIIGAIIQLFFQLGLLKAVIELDRGGDADVSVMWSMGGTLVPAILAGIIVGFATFAGFLLLIIPGIILAFGLSMTMLVLVDEGVGPVEAVQESWAITDGRKGFLFVQALAMLVITLAIYVVTCCIGAPIAGGAYVVVQAVTYNALKGAR